MDEKETAKFGTPERDAQLDANEAVKLYVDATLKADHLAREAVSAAERAKIAELARQEEWREVRRRKARAGVYSFKEHGRMCVVVPESGDYPKLTVVIQ